MPNSIVRMTRKNTLSRFTQAVPRTGTMMSRGAKSVIRFFTRKRSPTMSVAKHKPFLAFFYVPRTVFSKRNVYVIVYKLEESGGYSKTIFVTQRGHTEEVTQNELIPNEKLMDDVVSFRKEYMYDVGGENYDFNKLYHALKPKIKSAYTAEWFHTMGKNINDLKHN